MNESFNHAGAWGITLIVIVLVSWFFYRYFAPNNWREWVGAGAVQAFIIALYAEMYGFPLTIYLLVRFFGLDSEYMSASLWSSFVGLGETGMLISMLLGYALAFIGIYRLYFKTRKFSWVMTRKLSETLSRNFVHSCGMVSRMNARMASANCF